jgi:hypothetical protein
MILVKPPSNLSDTPPFKSEHRDGITKIQLDQWKSLFESSQEHYKDNAGHAAQLLNHALGFDDQHALTLYMLGRCHYLLGATNEARMLLTEARDKDICPLRMTSPLENRLITTASESNTPLLDAHQLLERECPGHILGDHMLVDHVHPTFRGNQMIANALIAELERRGWARPDDDWRAVAESAFQEHFATLDDAYFVKGDRTLKHLEMWTRARQGFEEGKKN